MTSTEPVSLTAKEVRRVWISELYEAVASLHDTDSPPVVWHGLLLVMKEQGPGLADPSNTWWPRRLRWLDLQLERGHSEKWIVIKALSDMQFANENDGR